MHPILQEYTSRFNTSGNYKINQFFTQLSLAEYHDKLSYLFDIENFCIRLFIAKLLGQKICIYSDYDTDAVTATATMYHGLMSLGFEEKHLEFYAPDRFVEGYGMNTEAISDLAKKYDLIISVDCGINSVQEAEIVKNLKSEKSSKCDLIITDHHHLHGNLPDCIAVINPRLSQYYATTLEVKVNRSEYENFKSNWQNSSIFAKNDVLKEKVHTWVQKVTRKPQEVLESPNMFLSSSLTGVGVAWFCLVWLGYFLAEVDRSVK